MLEIICGVVLLPCISKSTGTVAGVLIVELFLRRDKRVDLSLGQVLPVLPDYFIGYGHSLPHLM